MAEGHQEIPVNNPERPLDKKLKKDSVDKTPFDNPQDIGRIISFYAVPLLSVAGSLGYVNYLAYRLAESQMTAYSPVFSLNKDLLIAAESIFAARGVKDLITQQYQFHKARKTERTHSIAEEELGYRADRCVYQGEKPIEIGGDTFKKGDNFYFVQMSPMPHDITESSPEALSAWLDAYNYSISDIKERLKDKDYQFVAIDTDMSSHPSQQPLDSTSKGSRKELFAGKQGRKIKEEQKQSLLFTREEFENLTESPHEIFEKLTRALSDKMFSHLVSLAKQAKTANEKSNINALLKRTLHQILHHEVEMRFNSTPEVTRKLDEDHIPQKPKTYQSSQIQETESELMFFTVNYAEGEIHSTPLNVLLKTKEQPLEEILASTDPIKKAQIAYILHNILRETELEDLIREPIKNKDEIISNLNKHGLQVSQLHEGVSKLVEKKVLPPGTLKKLRLLLAPFILYSAIQQGILISKNVEDIPFLNNIVSSQEEAIVYIFHSQNIAVRSELGFHNGLPNKKVDWNIARAKEISADGYYITGTSHVFENKVWKQNEKVVSLLDLPKHANLGPDDPHIILTTSASGIEKASIIKIPVKENTRIAAVDISPIGMVIDPEEREKMETSLKFRIEEIADGTIQIRLLSVPEEKYSPYYLIHSTLVPTGQTTIHATENVSPIDVTKLSKETLNQLGINKDSSSQSSEEMFDRIKENHEYSLDPPKKEKLKRAKTPEEVVNAIVDLSGCSCEICNSAAVLASTVQKETSPIKINMAYGYIMNGNHLAGSSTEQAYLRSDAFHAFGITSNGEILDATPSKIADDPLTQAYVKQLHSPVRDPQPKPPVDDASKELVSGEMKLLAAFLAAGAGVVGTLQTARFLKKPETDEKMGSIADNVVAGIYSIDDLQKAYEFFEWLSWKKPGSSQPPNQKIEFSNKEEALAKIRSVINYERLAQYVERPKSLERVALRRKGIAAMVDKLKLRSLASYLLV